MIWESAIPPEMCKLIIKKAEETQELIEDSVYSRRDSNERVTRNNRVRNTSSYTTQDLWINLFAAGWILEANRQMYNYDLSKYDREPTCIISKYTDRDNSFFAPHVDFGVEKESGLHTRKLSLSMQLSSEYEYEGGELILYYHHQSSKIDGKPVQNEFLVPKSLGTVVVFDSRVVHEVTPITRGTRHAPVSYTHLRAHET